MTGNENGITRRRFLGGILAVAVASAAMGAGTMAYFSDTESSSDNTVQAGTLNLDFDGSTTFDLNTALAPMQSTTGSVTLVNDGSVSGTLAVNVSYSERDTNATGPDMSAQKVAQNLHVVALTYGNDSLLDGQELSGNPTLDELSTNDQTSGAGLEYDLINLADPQEGTIFTVELELADVGDGFQGDGVSITVTFYLNQND